LEIHTQTLEEGEEANEKDRIRFLRKYDEMLICERREIYEQKLAQHT